MRKFSVDARTILRLGRDSIRDHSTAVVELVKNSYDAGATHVSIEIMCGVAEPFIRISDDGCGMTEKEIVGSWLRIGYSSKSREQFTDLRRRKTGEKGIGRISADRLGSKLRLVSRSKGERAVGLEVNWNDFDVDGANIDSIEIPELEDPAFSSENRKHGTELTITGLRQLWTPAEIDALYLELSLLVSPFEQPGDFGVFLKSDVWPKGSAQVICQLPKGAELEFFGRFDGSTLHYTIKYRHKQKTTSKPNEEVTWNELVGDRQENLSDGVAQALSGLEVSLLFFVQKAELLSGTGFSLRDLQNFLKLNAGVKIYRDKVRVKPYGDSADPQGDWLALAERRSRNPAGVGRKSYRIAPNQLVGAVMLGRDTHPRLIDSTSREGLINNSEFFALRALVLGCVAILEAARHREYVKPDEQSPVERAAESIQTAHENIKKLRTMLATIRKEVPSAAKPLELTIDQTAIVSRALTQTEQSIQAMAGQISVYRGLATIGIASAVFGHETQSAIDEFRAAAQASLVQLKMNPPRVNAAIDELKTSMKYSVRVAAWGAFALSRVQHEKRKRRDMDVKNLCTEIIKHLKPVFDTASIDLKDKISSVSARGYEMDFEAIILNLLTNAYHACHGKPRSTVLLELSKKVRSGLPGFQISVSDSGPGVPAEFTEKIWEPLFSTRVDKHGKQVGTGLGLAIVRSILNEQNGFSEITRDPTLGGARFDVWLPSA